MADSFYMGLTIPTPRVTLGPEYASDISGDLNLIDVHDHSQGKGARVPSAGLNINADLPFNNYNLTGIRSVRFAPQATPISGSTDLAALSVSGVDLYYRDGNGTSIRFTQGGSIIGGASGNIQNLTEPASANFDGGNFGGGTFQWFQNSSWFARMQMGAILLVDSDHDNPEHQITIKSPYPLAGDYTLTLPTALPGALKRILTFDSTGQMGMSGPVPTTTAFVCMSPAGDLQYLADFTGGIATANLADGAVTRPKSFSLGQVYSVSSGAWVATSATGSGNVTVNNLGVTQVAVSLATAGLRPINVRLEWDQAVNEALIALFKTTAANLFNPIATLSIDAYWTISAVTHVQTVASKAIGGSFPTSVNGVQGQLNCEIGLEGLFVPPAGAQTYTFKLSYRCNPGGTSIAPCCVRLVAWET